MLLLINLLISGIFI